MLGRAWPSAQRLDFRIAIPVTGVARDLLSPVAMSPLHSRVLGAALLVAGASLAACFGSVAATPPLVCAEGQRAFNGACRQTCSDASPGCKSPAERCAEVEGKTALCLEAAGLTCSYLGDDTECEAHGQFFTYATRQSQGHWSDYSSYPYDGVTDPGALTDNEDDHFTIDAYAAESVTSLGDPTGICRGNARWVPGPAVGPVACQGTHAVQRCQLVRDYRSGRQGCLPLPGTTVETVAPAN
jgi:hypothetical protein